MEYNVTVQWDSASQEWVAICDEVMGMILQAGTIEELIDKLRVSLPEELEINGMPPMSILHVQAEYREWID